MAKLSPETSGQKDNMDRETYNTCIAKGLSGQTGLSQEERRLAFCSTSKLCSGKASTPAEAQRVCLLPKPEKPAGTRAGRGSKCLTQVDTIIECLIKNTDFSAKDVAAELRNSVPLCVCGRKQTRAMKETAMIASMTPEHRAALELMAQMKQVYAPKEVVNA